jgi:hypothetical protein
MSLKSFMSSGLSKNESGIRPLFLPIQAPQGTDDLDDLDDVSPILHVERSDLIPKAPKPPNVEPTDL